MTRLGQNVGPLRYILFDVVYVQSAQNHVMRPCIKWWENITSFMCDRFLWEKESKIELAIDMHFVYIQKPTTKSYTKKYVASLQCNTFGEEYFEQKQTRISFRFVVLILSFPEFFRFQSVILCPKSITNPERYILLSSMSFCCVGHGTEVLRGYVCSFFLCNDGANSFSFAFHKISFVCSMWMLFRWKWIFKARRRQSRDKSMFWMRVLLNWF